MNKLNISLTTLTATPPSPELLTDLVAGVLRSVGVHVTSCTLTKVAEDVTITRRAPKQAARPRHNTAPLVIPNENGIATHSH